MTPSDDERLVQDALAGDPPSRRRLATRLLGTIQREVVAVLRRSAAVQLRDPRQEAQEMTQEVLVTLFERSGQELRRWDPQRGRSLDSFVRLVARRKVARILGQRRGNPWANEPVDPQVLEDDEEGDGLLLRQLEQRNLLARVLDLVYADMSPRDLELFQLLFVDEHEPQEVADALGMSRGAVNAWCYRTRKLVRNIARAAGSPATSSSGDSTAKEIMSHGR
jgi:RNA polymerase sigma-70 factor (ECF subfamily)